MAYIVRMPKLGVEMKTGTVVDWYVDVDEPVAEDDVIAIVESEKTTTEVTAREPGVLREKYLDEHGEAPPGTPLGIIAAADDAIAQLKAQVGVDDDSQAPDMASRDGANSDQSVTESTADAQKQDHGTERTPEARSDDIAPRTPEGRIKATPKARRRAKQRDVALSTVTGSGPEGCIVARDVDAADADGRTRTVREERPLTPMRSTIADRLQRSAREIPHVTVDRAIDVEATSTTAEQTTDRTGRTVTLTDFIVAAVAETLVEHPAFNATFDADDGIHTLYNELNIGVAVDVDGGLLTPVLPDVRGMTPEAIADVRGRLVDRVLEGDHRSDDHSGGTFTISNLGAIGADSFTPIINPPEVAILGIGRVRNRVVQADTDLDIRRTITFSLSFDHRVVDGADAARFLTTLETYLQDPSSLPGNRE